MKVKATIVLDLENKKIVDIIFDNKVLNRSSGIGQVKAFIRRKILNTPIQKFEPELKQYGGVRKIYFSFKMELDIYTLIEKVENTNWKLPYKCKLSPLPISGKDSHISFEEYEKLFLERKNLS